MARWFILGICVPAALLLAACGGGDAPGAAAPVKSGGSGIVGTFSSGCDSSDLVVLAATGDPVHVRSWLTVGERAGSGARIALRLDFHLDASCAGPAVAQLHFDDPGNNVRYEGAALVSGRLAQKVVLQFAGTGEGSLGEDGSLEFGNEVRLRGPAGLRAAAAHRDFWLLEGELLYEGGLAAGADGYPLGLEWEAPSERVRG